MGRDIEKSFEKITSSLKELEFEDVLVIVDKVVAQNPNNVDCLAYKAIALERNKKYTEAEALINKLMDEQDAGNHVIVLLALGLLLGSNKKNFQGAIRFFDQALEIDSKNEYVVYRRGFAKSKVNDYEGAIKDFEKAIEIDSHFILAWRGLADAHADFTGLKQAIDIYSKAISVNPQNADLYMRKAQAKVSNNDLEGGLDVLDTGLVVLPSNADMWVYKSYFKMNINDFQGASLDAERAIELDPKHVVAWNNLAQSKKHLGKKKEALKDLNRAVKIDPGYSQALENRAKLKLELGDYKGGLADFSAAIKTDPSNSSLWIKRGRAKLSEKDFQGAIQDFTKALGLDSEDMFALVRRGIAKELSGRIHEAILDYSKAIESQPDYLPAWVNRAQCRLSQGEFTKALEDISQALRLDPEDIIALNVEQKILLNTGDFELAISNRLKYFSITNIPKPTYLNEEFQEISLAVHSHITENIQSKLAHRNEKLIDFWECYLLWGDDETISIVQGRSSSVEQGSFGVGYVCLTDKLLRIVSLGKLSKKFGKRLRMGLGIKIIAAALGHIDMKSIEREDKTWDISFRDIQGLVKEETLLRISAISEKWEIRPLLDDKSDFLHAALDLARAGNLKRTIDMGKLRIKGKSANSISDEDVFEKIEKLKHLLEIDALTQSEFDEKKAELLSRI
jgi:tetratricopeptide (TPR) repeat protein